MLLQELAVANHKSDYLEILEQSSEHHQEIGKMEKENHFDVLIIGAGISGIDAAYHIQKHCDWVRNKSTTSEFSVFSNPP